MSLKDEPRPMPEWLAQLEPTQLAETNFPLQSVLRQSLYYPASGCDGRPVEFMAGFIHSFIYVDYGVASSTLEEEVRRGFSGYHLAGFKRLSESDLAPKGWHPYVPPQFTSEVKRVRTQNSYSLPTSPFANWYIFAKNTHQLGDHGPERFSLIYLCADGIAAYQALYWQKFLAPEVLAIIQPGTGFGGNYTDFRDPHGFLAWTVLRQQNQTVPRYMVCGGLELNYSEAFWPIDYPHHIEWWQHENGNGVWSRDTV